VTRTPVSRSKVQRSGSPGPLMLTHIVRHIFRIARLTKFKLGTRMENYDRISHRRRDLQGQRSRSQSYTISPMAHKSKTNSRSITKIGRKVAGTLRASFKVKRSKVRVTGQLTQAHKMCHIFRTVRSRNFKVGVRTEDVDPHQWQAP